MWHEFDRKSWLKQTFSDFKKGEDADREVRNTWIHFRATRMSFDILCWINLSLFLNLFLYCEWYETITLQKKEVSIFLKIRKRLPLTDFDS